MFIGKVEADLSDVTASCYDRQITTQVHVLSCIIFLICLPIIECFWNTITKDKGMAVSSVIQMNDWLNSPVSLIPSGLLYYRVPSLSYR